MTSRRRWTVLLLSLAITLVAGEVLLRAAGPAVLPEPEEWPSPSLAVKAAQLDDLAARGVSGGIVLAGNSQVAALDPQPLIDAGLGPEVWNGAIPAGGDLELQRRWLLDHVVPALHPSMVVLGISDLDPDDDGLVERWRRSRATASGFLAQTDRAAAAHLAVVHHRPSLRGPDQVLESLLGDEPAAPVYGPRGEEAGLYRWPITELSAEDRAALGAPRPTAAVAPAADVAPEASVDAMRRLADELEAAGVQLVLITLPVPTERLDLTGDSMASTLEVHEGIAEQVGVRHIDLTPGLGATTSYRDRAHLTVESARMALARLATALGGTPPDDDERVLLATDDPEAAIRRVTLRRRRDLAIDLTDLHLPTTIVVNLVGDRTNRIVLREAPAGRSAAIDDRPLVTWTDPDGALVVSLPDDVLDGDARRLQASVHLPDDPGARPAPLKGPLRTPLVAPVDP